MPELASASPRRRGVVDASVSIAGGAATGGAMFILSVIAARHLERPEFAHFAVALVLAQIVTVFTTVGLDVAASRTIGHARDRADAISSTALALGCASALLVGALTVAASPVIGDALDVSAAVVALGGVAGVVLGLRLVSERTCAALGRFQAQLLVKIVEAALLVTLASVAFGALDSDWRGGIVPVGIAAFVAVSAYAFTMRSNLRAGAISRDVARELSPYARYAFMSSLLIVAITYSDKLVLLRGAGPDEYAIYTAYFAGTIMVAGQVIIVLQNVLIPRAADPTLRRSLLDELDRWKWISIPVLAVAGSAALATVLLLFGPNYPIERDRFLLFVLWWVVFCRNAVLATILIASTREAYRSELRFMFVRVAVTLGTFALLAARGHVGFLTVAGTMVAVELAETANLMRLRQLYLDPDHTTKNGAAS